MAASKPKFGASIQVPPFKLGQASAFGKKLTLQKTLTTTLPPLSRANVQKNAEEHAKRKSTTKDLLENLCERVTQRVSTDSPSIKPASSIRSKSIDGRSSKSRRTSGSRHIRHRRISTMSRCSSRSSRSHFKRRRRKRFKSRSMSSKQNDNKIQIEIEQLSESFKVLCKIYGEKSDKTGMTKGTTATTAKRGPKKRKQSDNTDVATHATSTPNAKRRNKKASQTLTQSPDDHKLPLKKRHYLLANGEKGGEISDDEEITEEVLKRKSVHEKKDFERLRAQYDEAIEACISKYGGASPIVSPKEVPKSKDTTNKNVSPKKRHLLKTTQESVTSPLTIDTKSTPSEKSETTVSKKRNRLESVVSKISPTESDNKTENKSNKKAAQVLLSPDTKTVTKKLRSDPSNFKQVINTEILPTNEKSSANKKGSKVESQLTKQTGSNKKAAVAAKTASGKCFFLFFLRFRCYSRSIQFF